jgi:hypothetical protein
VGGRCRSEKQYGNRQSSIFLEVPVRRTVLRLLAAVSVVGGLLVVPFAVNISTGGEAPAWLRPYADWLWPVAIGCVVIAAGLAITTEKFRFSGGAISVRRPNDTRNYGLALAQVGRYVAARQGQSLAERARIALALDDRPTVVRQPVHLVGRDGGNDFQLSADLKIVDVFEEMSESMLILGAAGAGKTTLLLDLATALIGRAKASMEPDIPVVVDLVDWPRLRAFARFRTARHTSGQFVAWLLTSIQERYRIPKVIGRTWLTDNRFTLLLDGLDELSEADRKRCVREINDLQTRFGVTRLAVCSREADYEGLGPRLQLQGAVVIRPLTRDQVNAYLGAISPRLSGVAMAFGADDGLWKLLTTPLMLNIMELTDDDQTWRMLADARSQVERQQVLFDAYVVEVLARRKSHEWSNPERALRAMQMLATVSGRHGSGVGVVRLNFRSLSAVADERIGAVASLYLIPATLGSWGLASSTAMGFGVSAAAGLITGGVGLGALLVYSYLARQSRPGNVNRLALLSYFIAATLASVALAFALMRLVSLPQKPPTVAVAAAALAFAVVAAGFHVVVSTRDLIDDSEIGPGFYIAILVIIGFGVVVATLVLIFGVSWGALMGWAVGFGCGLFAFSELNAFGELLPSDLRNEKVARRPMLVLWGSPIVLAPLVVSTSWFTPFWLPLAGWLVGLLNAVYPGSFGTDALAGAYARTALVVAGEPVPWRRKFLRFAVDRSLLTYANGSYQFVHLLIRDHLAQCDPRRLGVAVLRRRAELGHPISRSGRSGDAKPTTPGSAR